MKSCSLFLLLVLALLLPRILPGQDLETQKRSHQGVFLQTIQTKQIFKNSFAPASSKFGTGLAIGFYQHFDLAARLQFRIGGGLSAYRVDERDYSPVFGLDIDPRFGIDIKKSYVDNDADILQITLPVNLRYKLWGAAEHVFVALGFEGRYVLADDITAHMQESGIVYREFDPSPFYHSRELNVAAHLEFGYEFEIMQSRKMHVSILAKHSLLSQFADDFHGSAFYHILNSRALDIGVGLGVIF